METKNKYKITVELITEYPETNTVYESESGRRYYSRYGEKYEKEAETNKITEKEIPTGKILTRTDEVYSQEFVAVDIKKIVKIINED